MLFDGPRDLTFNHKKFDPFHPYRKPKGPGSLKQPPTIPGAKLKGPSKLNSGSEKGEANPKKTGKGKEEAADEGI